jgi:hypothetical protein
MSFKVVRNVSGKVVAFGPNDDGYEPTGDYSVELECPAPELTPSDLLSKLDADNQLTQRNLRETVMLMSEAFKQVTGGAVDLSTIPGVAKVYEVEAQAAVLRSQL